MQQQAPSNEQMGSTDDRRHLVQAVPHFYMVAPSAAAARYHQRLYCEERHDAGDDAGERRSAEQGLVSKWRQKDKLKTTAVALVLCLNIGVDPPDVIKISPCARLECWVDPLSMQPAKALETIGKNLQAQYERWQPRAKYKMHLDPTMDDVKKLCISCRRTAKNERVLFHYNGHGVPRPTVNGEIWVFNSRYTQYIPLSIYELQTWLGTPCIYVLDCSAAGVIINNFKALIDSSRQQQLAVQQQQQAAAAAAAAAAGMLGSNAAAAAAAAAAANAVPPVDPMREVILLGACGANELLPQNPDLPADVFTACLTTPIKVALRWFCSRSLLRHDGVSKELIDRIPGRQTDRKTPLGELNWIFTAITDTIAWNSLPRALFQKLFRQDLLVASLFRNFLLAERILAASNCCPVSYPRLPPTHQHPMWQAWDLAAEMCLLQLPKLLADPNAEFVPSTFFSEQLTAFELWLAHGSADKKPPEQLPIVLQVLLSQVHRLRALVLLGRFLDMGSWAVDLALSVGIFPYVLKLLQTTSSDLRTTLVFIWAKILALDRTCQADLVKDNGHVYFLKYLDAPEPTIDNTNRAQAAFVLAVVCDGHSKGQLLCAAANLLQVLLKWLRALLPVMTANSGNLLLVKWLCLCLGKLADNMPDVATAAVREGAADLLAGLLTAQLPHLRAAGVFALGSLIHSVPRRSGSSGSSDAAAAAAAAAGGGEAAGVQPPAAGAAGGGGSSEQLSMLEMAVVDLLAKSNVVYDGSPLVRGELAVAYARLARGSAAALHDAVCLMQDTIQLQQQKTLELLQQQQQLLHQQQRQQQQQQQLRDDVAAAAAAGGSSSSTGSGIPRPGSGGNIGSSSSSHEPPPLATDGSTAATAAVSAPQRPVNGSWGSGEGSGGSSGKGSWRGDGGLAGTTASGFANSSGIGVGWCDIDGSEVVSAGGVSPGTKTLYEVVEQVLLLATDPSGKVAKLGRQVLSLAGLDLAPVPIPSPPTRSASAAAAAGSSSSSAAGPSHLAHSASMPPPGSAASSGPNSLTTSVGGVGSSLGSLTQKFVKSSRSWRSGFSSTAASRTAAAAGGGGSSSSTPPGGSSPPSPAKDGTVGGGAMGGTPPGQAGVGAAAGFAAAGGNNAAAAAAGYANLLQSGYSRNPFMLRSTGGPGTRLPGPEGPVPGLAGGASSSSSSSYGVGLNLSSMSVGALGGTAAAAAAAGDPAAAAAAVGGMSRGSSSAYLCGDQDAGGLLPELPPSQVYKLSCEYFSRPMLEPQASAWREVEGSKLAPWVTPPDSLRKAQRLREMEAARLRCRSATCPKIREQVNAIETHAESITAVVFHSFHLLLISIDSKGYVRVNNGADGNLLNAFHVSNGAPAPGPGVVSGPDPTSTPTGCSSATITYARQLNEAESNLLLTGAADGCVRVWRAYLNQGLQRLASAWQAVPIRQPPGPLRQAAAYALTEYPALLYAAGGCHPDVLQVWDLATEMVMQQIPVRSSAGASGCPVAMDRLSAAQSDPRLLLTSCSDGLMRLFDLRASLAPVASIAAAGKGGLAGMVLEPCGKPATIVAGTCMGQLLFMDLRMVADGDGSINSGAAGGSGSSSSGSSDQLRCSVVRQVDAHIKGGMSVMVAHPTAPLLATGSTSQVVKVWTDVGDVVGAIRSQSPSSAPHHGLSPITCMAWHPYNLYLGAASSDSVASVYIVDNVPSSNMAASGVSYAPTSVSSFGPPGGTAASVVATL